VIGDEVFQDIGKARLAVTHHAGSMLGKPVHEFLLDPENEEVTIVERDFEDKTHTGEECKRIARWEIRPLTVRPFTH